MSLSPRKVERFFSLWIPLLAYVNARERLGHDPKCFVRPWRLTAQDAAALRNELWASPNLLDDYVMENPNHLHATDLATVKAWRHRESGRFIVARFRKRDAVLLTVGNPTRAFAVLGLASSWKELLRQDPPVLVEAVLLPFGDLIVHDGLLVPYGIEFGASIRRDIMAACKRAQASGEIVTAIRVGQ